MSDEDLLADYRDLTDVALRRSLEVERGLYMARAKAILESLSDPSTDPADKATFQGAFGAPGAFPS